MRNSPAVGRSLAFLLLLGLLCGRHVSLAAGAGQDVSPLRPGSPIERELAAGQPQTYQIRLETGQFLRVIVEQLSIDVVIQVLAPAGRSLFEIDSESRLRGTEAASLVAETPGDYRVVIRPSQPGAAAGTYQIRIDEPRASTEQERALHEAHKWYDEALKLRDAGRYDEALPLFERVVTTHQELLGPNDPNLAAVLHDQAVFYFYKGDYPQAELASQRALAIQEQALGPDHPAVAASLNLLAVLCFNRGDYARAEPLSQRALSIRERALGPEHPNLGHYLNNLARLYYNKGEYGRALPLYERALSIRERAFGPENPFVAQSLNNLATLYYNQGDNVRAEQLHLRALAIREKLQGPDHPSVAETLGNLANIYRDRKDYGSAERLYQRALAIQEKSLGPQRPHVSRTLNNLAVFYAAQGRIAQAVAVQTRANAISEYNLALNLVSGSERQKLAYLTLLSRQTEFTLSLHTQAAPNNPEALRLAFTTLLARKGRGLDAMADTVATLRRHATPQDQQLFDQLAEARSQLADLTLRDSGGATPESYPARLKPLEEQVETLEAALSARSAEFRAQTQPVTLGAVQATLPADSLLIEFVLFTPQPPLAGKNSSPRYLAYLLAAQGPPKCVDLGEAAPIDRAVKTWRQALRETRVDVKRLARIVDEKIMRPVRSMAEQSGEIRQLLIAPDGTLNLIPFAALVDEENRYLVERYTISYLTSGRDLLRLQTLQPSRSAPLVVADPIFGRLEHAARRKERNPAGHQAAGPIDSARIFFRPLPGTKNEALAIKAILPEASLLLRGRATETALKQARAPQILHIATHGFFLNDQKTVLAAIPDDPRGTRNRSAQSNRGEAPVENPLMRSGLALAGANRGRTEEGDGVLTALEVAGLDLWGTKLVVLSACDTGVGEVKKGEGVQGLRRALVLAGSESQVMSLWPVTDEGAKDFMIDYYRALRRGEGRSEGLRQVQLRMLRSADWRHPFYWAAFIQSGEWAGLEVRR
ncbi:MAG TPA: CHAT domain-containing tetratricopeptide repeat protein [Blastocatellia bacterium]|nr:CHAT domain-containing tetratricopeptide repeat protein [Blastocatellia bacterium]